MKSRLVPPETAGPPKAPLGSRVSAMRQGSGAGEMELMLVLESQREGATAFVAGLDDGESP